MDPLRTHRVILCEKLDVGKIIPYLRQDRMLTADEYETLTNPIYNTKVRRNKLLDMMPRKGKRYFEHFGNNLVWSGQTELAKHIGVDVDKVPPTPHELEPEPEPVDPYAQMLQLFSNSMASVPPASNVHPYNPHVAYHPRPPPSTFQNTHQPYSSTTAGYTPAQAPPPRYPNPAAGILSTSTAVTVHRPIEGDSKVFILYCKDTTIPNISADQWFESILQLADLLNRCGRIKCSMDSYVQQPQTNWNRWTMDQINESNFVVLVMSPMLSSGLYSSEHRDLAMENGRFYCDSIANMVQAPLFVPVFLNGCEPEGNLRDWLLPSLAMGSSFKLHNFADFVRGSDSGMDDDSQSDEAFHRYIEQTLAEPRFRSMASLISHLRGEAGIDRPPQPAVPVAITHHHASPEFQPVPEAEYISREDLNSIASRVNREWQHLGIRLGLTRRTGLLEISSRYPSDFRQAALEMLYTWQRVKGRNATRRALKKALLEQSLGRLATEIFPNEQI